MSYDEGSHNYKVTARLKLTSNWLSNKIAIFLVIFALIAGMSLVPSVKEKAYVVYDAAIFKVYSVVNNLNFVISSSAESISNYIDLEEKYKKVQKENEDLKIQLSMYQDLAQENKSLKRILKYKVNGPQFLLTTQILTSSIDGYIDIVRIPVGEINGVKIDDIVVDGDKLIGRVIGVKERRSKVAIITSSNHVLPVRFMQSEAKAILRGDTGGKLVIKLMNAEGSKLEKGELVVTSGDGKIFPPNIIVGKVTNADPGNIEVTPFFDPENMYRVSILRG